MDFLFFGSWLLNNGFDLYKRGTTFFGDVCRLYNNDGAWLIADNGVFINSREFNSCGSYPMWTYFDNSIFCESPVKKLPFLSCVFRYNDVEVCMDDFLEKTKASLGVPLPVLMAAFSISEKKLFHWHKATFEAYLRNGDTITFKGNAWAEALQDK